MFSDIRIYENSHNSGLFGMDKVDELFEMYEECAYDLAEQLDHDSVVLYAVFDYLPGRYILHSVDFMMYTMPYNLYVRFAAPLMNTSRLFFMRGRKDKNES